MTGTPLKTISCWEKILDRVPGNSSFSVCSVYPCFKPVHTVIAPLNLSDQNIISIRWWIPPTTSDKMVLLRAQVTLHVSRTCIQLRIESKVLEHKKWALTSSFKNGSRILSWTKGQNEGCTFVFTTFFDGTYDNTFTLYRT